MFAAVAAQISRCAVATLCPSDADLKAAIYDRTEEEIAEYYNSAPPMSGDFVLMHAIKVQAVEDVHCGEASPEEAGTVSCSFTATFPTSVQYEIVKLVRKDGRWRIIEAHALNRWTHGPRN